MDSEPYQPIACSTYDIYEIAIMRGQILDLCWRDAEGEHTEQVKPLQLKITNGEEFLIFQGYRHAQNDTKQVRLDKITHAEIKGP